MKVNPGKCQVLLGTKKSIDVDLEGACAMCSRCEKLLDITIDSDLKLDKHKVSEKKALFRVTGQISLEKSRIVMVRFVESQFNYGPLIWLNIQSLAVGIYEFIDDRSSDIMGNNIKLPKT